MLPSNKTLSNNLQTLLNRYKKQIVNEQGTPFSVFLHPNSEVNQNPTSNLGKQSQLLNTEPKKIFIEERIRLINNYSFKKMKSMQRKKRNLSHIIQQNTYGNRYNMSVDSTIQLPQQTNHHHSRSRDSSIETLFEQRMLKRRGSTFYLIKVSNNKSKLQSKINKSIQGNDHFQLDNDFKTKQNRKYEGKKKQWAASKAPITRKQSPRQILPIINFNNILNTKNIEMQCIESKIKDQQQKVEVKTISLKKTKQQKQNIITPIITTLQPKQHTKKSYTKSRHCKQIFFNRILKAKTQSLKPNFNDEKICAWGAHPSFIQQQDSPILYSYDY